MSGTDDEVDLPRRSQIVLLVVDDDDAFLERACRALKNGGFGNALTALDLASAHGLIVAHNPRLALVDLDLGKEKENGIELVKQLGAQQYGPIPVVLSGDRTQEQFFRAARAGAVDFLVKGPHLDLAREVARILSGNRGAVKGCTLPEIIPNLGYLRTFGLTNQEIALLVDFANDFPKISSLAERRDQTPIKLRKIFSRIYEKLDMADIHQLVRTLTICELFNKEN